MELTQTWQNPSFRFATIREKAGLPYVNAFRPETHCEREGKSMEKNKGRVHLSRFLFGLLILFSAGVWTACIGLTLFH